MQSIREVQIRNFRSCRELDIQIGDIVPLVGRNNAGKSNVLLALQWVFEGQHLADEDFFDKSQAVSVAVHLAGLDDVALGRLADKHQKKLDRICSSGYLWVRRVQPAGSKKAAEQITEISPGPDAPIWQPLVTGIDASIKALYPEVLFIRAMEDALEDSTKNRTTTTIGKLISLTLAPALRQQRDGIAVILKPLTDLLTATGARRPADISAFDNRVSQLLGKYLAGITARLHVPELTSEDLLKTATIKVFEGADVLGRDLEQFGHGTQRTMQLALIETLAALAVEGTNTLPPLLMLIDEPELYLHPQAVEDMRLALHALAANGVQVVFTTHSAHMLGIDDLPTTSILYKDNTGTRIRSKYGPAVAQALADYPAQAHALIDLRNAKEIFFSERILLVEGPTEERLIPTLFEKLVGRTSRHLGIGVVGMGSCAGLKSNRDILVTMGIRPFAIVDLDFAFTQAVRQGFLSKDHPSLAACLPLMASAIATAGCGTDPSSGLPMKANGVKPQKAFELLAEDPLAKPHIYALHTELKESEIWLWPGGTLEVHLGLAGKGESVWQSFLMELLSKDPRDVVADLTTVTDCLTWASRQSVLDNSLGQ